MNKDKIIGELKKIFPEDDLLLKHESILCYTYNAGGDPPTKPYPLAVVFPTSTEQVSAVMKLANAEKVPVVPRGEATNLARSAIPMIQDCIVVSTKKLQGIEVDPNTLTATVGAGVITAELKAEAAKHGLFYPPDPASFKFASIGGNVGTDAGGLLCVKYGTTKNYILGLEVVLASGEIIHTGGKCVKNVAGYNLTSLFVGSEGTLGIVTKVTAKLLPLPEGKRTMIVAFENVENAARAVSKIMVNGVIPAIMEFMENTFIRGVEDYAHCDLPVDAAAILLIEVDGDLSGLDRQIEKISEVCKGLGATQFKIARDDKEADEFWTARRAALPALARVAKGRLGGDPAVPIDRLPDVIRKLRELEVKYNLKCGCQGHAGDGNVHPHFFFNNPEEKARAAEARSEFHKALVGMGGTVTAEHGVGQDKAGYLKLQLGEGQLELMKTVKRAFDPNNILNPGCIFGGM